MSKNTPTLGEHYTTPIAVGVEAHGWARLDERTLADDGVTYAVEV